MLVHDGGEPAELVEPDGLGILLGRAARHERHRVHVQRVAVDLGDHHVGAIRGGDQLRRGNRGLGAQGLHPRQLRADRLQRVVTGPMHPQHDRLVVVDQVGGVLGQAEQPQRRLAVAAIGGKGSAREQLMSRRQSRHATSVDHNRALRQTKSALLTSLFRSPIMRNTTETIGRY